MIDDREVFWRAFWRGAFEGTVAASAFMLVVALGKWLVEALS